VIVGVEYLAAASGDEPSQVRWCSVIRLRSTSTQLRLRP